MLIRNSQYDFDNFLGSQLHNRAGNSVHKLHKLKTVKLRLFLNIFQFVQKCSKNGIAQLLRLDVFEIKVSKIVRFPRKAFEKYIVVT